MARGSDGRQRDLTWGEREHYALLAEQGIADVYLEPEDASPAFWSNAHQAIEMLDAGAVSWPQWQRDMRWSLGLPDPLKQYAVTLFRTVVVDGTWGRNGGTLQIGPRLTALELVLDQLEEHDLAFAVDALNDRAVYHRVGLRVGRVSLLPDHRRAPARDNHPPCAARP